MSAIASWRAAIVKHIVKINLDFAKIQPYVSEKLEMVYDIAKKIIFLA